MIKWIRSLIDKVKQQIAYRKRLKELLLLRDFYRAERVKLYIQLKLCLEIVKQYNLLSQD